MRPSDVTQEPGHSRLASRRPWVAVLLVFLASMALLWVSFYVVDSRGWSYVLRFVAFFGACFSPLIPTLARRRGH